jgi:hypothetical protein
MNALRAAFSGGHRIVLMACAAVVVVAGGILLIDALFIRKESVPMQDALPVVAQRLGLTLEPESEDSEWLSQRLQQVPQLAAADIQVGPVLTRADALHRLWLFEFGVAQTVLVSNRPQGGLHAHQAVLDRLALVVQVHGARLPSWVQDVAPPSSPPWTAEALTRLARIEDLRLATDGEFIIAVARPGAFGLYEMMARQRSVESYPGLLNSALPIDVQRVLDIVNLIRPEQGALPPIYRIDVQVRLPEIREPQIGARMEEVRTQQRAQVAELRARLEADREAMRAKLSADSAKQREQLLRRVRDAAGTDAFDTAESTKIDAAPPADDVRGP